MSVLEGDLHRLLVRASDPATGAAGDEFFLSTTSKVRVHNGTSWADVGTAGVTPPACRITGTASMPATAFGAAAKIACNTVAVNSPAYWNTGTARYIPLLAGRYACVAYFHGTVVGAAGTLWELGIAKNGVIHTLMRLGSSTTYGPEITVSAQVIMNGSTDYIELWGAHGGGAALTGTETLDICYLGPN